LLAQFDYFSLQNISKLQHVRMRLGSRQKKLW
jgi:hypothetical protein